MSEIWIIAFLPIGIALVFFVMFGIPTLAEAYVEGKKAQKCECRCKK